MTQHGNSIPGTCIRYRSASQRLTTALTLAEAGFNRHLRDIFTEKSESFASTRELTQKRQIGSQRKRQKAIQKKSNMWRQ